MATQVSYEPPAKKAKRNNKALKIKPNLTPAEVKAFLDDLETRVSELENK